MTNKALSSDKPNGHWFEADWLHCKRRRAIKRWVPCGDMDRRLKIPHSAKAECGFRTTPEECLYDSGPIGPSV